MRNADEIRVSRPSHPLWVSLAKITAVMVVLTIPFWVSGLDMAFQSLFFKGGWYLDGNPIIRFLYRWGTLPGVLLACGGLLLLVRAGGSERRREWRRAAAALLITLFLGPGLMINGISKKYTGRPRPRQVETFGGNLDYRHVFDFGVPGQGHSFPAGHPSAGFLLFSLYFSFRTRHRRRARAWFGAGLAYGCVMGMGRIMQGAHFLSDVIWSGGMTLAAACIAHKWTGGDFPELAVKRRFMVLGRTTRAVAGIAVLALLILGILAATPFNLQSGLAMQNLRSLVLDVDAGDVVVYGGGAVADVRVTARGFAPPFSRYNAEWAHNDSQAVLRLRRRGFFVELVTDVKVALPPDFEGDLLVRCERGDVDLRDIRHGTRVLVETGSGRINITGEGSIRQVLIRNRKGDVQVEKGTNHQTMLIGAPGGVVWLPNRLQDRGMLFPMPGDVEGSCFGWQTEWGRVFVTALAIRFDGHRPKLQ